MLSLLLDENISHMIASQNQQSRPDIAIQSLHFWEGGRLLQASDEDILASAYAAGLTVITYDVQTIPPLLAYMQDRGAAHGGVIFVSSKSIPSHDFGALIRAIIRLWDEEKDREWANRLVFLKP